MEAILIGTVVNYFTERCCAFVGVPERVFPETVGRTATEVEETITECERNRPTAWGW